MINLAVIFHIVTNQRSLEGNISVSSFDLRVLGFLNGFNQLHCRLFTHVNCYFLDFFFLTLSGWLSRRLRSSLCTFLSCESCCFSFFLSLSLFIFSLLHDLSIFGRSNHSHCLHGVIPISVLSSRFWVWFLLNAESLALKINLVVFHSLK